MRFANILLFVVAALLGITLSVAAVWKLPFSVFIITEDHFGSVIKLLKTDFAPDKFYAAEALKDIVQWGDIINFVFATMCAVLAVMPALFTIRWAESKLFERTAVMGWKVIKFMAVLGAFVVALWPVPMAGIIYVSLCAILICGYIVTYQWPKKQQTKDPLQMPALQRREVPPHDRPAGQL